MRETRSQALGPVLLCAFALTACILLASPYADTGMNDDWSYAWSARVLVETGHVVYNGWATAMLGWQLYLGALFIKLFGFSFTALRFSVFAVAIASVGLAQRLFVRMGISSANAIAGALTLGLSPLFLPLAFSFMTDVPGFFCILLCIYGCVRAMQAESDRAALGWLAFAALTNVLGGTVRQVAWLGVLVMVPATALWMRRRRGAAATGAILWIVSAGAIFAMLHWFHVQPYSIVEPLLPKHRRSMIGTGVRFFRNFLDIFLLLLPVSAAFLVVYPWRKRVERTAALGAAVLLGGGLVFLARHGARNWLAPFAVNYFTPEGLVYLPEIPGTRAAFVPVWLQVGLTFLTLFSLLGFAACLTQAPGESDRLEEARGLSSSALLVLFGPFTAAYVLLIVTREFLYDRYFLALIFIALALALRFYQERYGRQLPAVCWVLILAFAAFGTLGMHDLFAMNEAKVMAVRKLEAQGIPRSHVRAGFDMDAWTQLELNGYVNDARLQIPANAYRPMPDPPLRDCDYMLASETPSIVPDYGLAYSATPCFAEWSGPVPYGTWLPPHNQAIHVLSLH